MCEEEVTDVTYLVQLSREVCYLGECVHEARTKTGAAYDLAKLVLFSFNEPSERAFGLV